ncbi:hypothetical protein B0T25DRAFT_578415 [Lasiosphaeria hispida]|uniref:Uncharacterized protein n=1 Tax=Lasiosphaeria hispida TaxID=260671 RepID=A0AAJ0HSJ7_9PEZI|nr:hypothetical protein B0T25DRAFT_578415 [Lasiosphaeria hispida]
MANPYRHGGQIDTNTGMAVSPVAAQTDQRQPHAPLLQPQAPQGYRSHPPPQPYLPQQQQEQQQPAPAQQDGVMGSKSVYAVDQFEVDNQSPVVVANNSRNAEKDFPVNVKAWHHIFTSRTDFRWKFVKLFQKPGWIYEDQTPVRHRDFAGRVSFKPNSDRYLHHQEGHLRNLIVQCTDDIFEAPHNATWQRTYIRKVSPLKSRIATWVIDFGYEPESWNDWWIMVLRAFPAAIAMTFFFWDLTQPREEFRGWYAPVPYIYHGEAKVWGNRLEGRKGLEVLPPANNELYRLLKPRHLCFLSDISANGAGQRRAPVRAVADWEAEEGKGADLRYLFVAYSTEQFNHNSPEDMKALFHIAERACRDANLPAYWVAANCMADAAELEADVYRISDVVRGARKMIIAVGPPGGNARGQFLPDTGALLQQWGSRMWTFPEALLSPGDSIDIYTRGTDLSYPRTISKNQFAARVWGANAIVSRQLVDHFVGNLGLSRLELAVLLLKCLYARQTKTWLDGDQAYALMGLLRLRPQIDQTDSSFQAFARLSLANDSDLLLERSICTLPAAGGDPNTVVVDGARGASIRWKSFYFVAHSTNLSWKRWFATFLMEYQFILFTAATVLLASRSPATAGGGAVLLLLYLWLWLMTPNLIRVSLGGKLTSVQAALFGFEGYLNPPTVERAIFGGNFNRFSWSKAGSLLSRSYVNMHGERIGMDPTKDMEVREKVEAAKRARGPGEMRVFTLVDTYNMEMTLFEAERPPVSLFLCGAEGGMQRAVACSYDFTRHTFYRETVLRMPTTSLNKMDRVSRFRFGTSRPGAAVRQIASGGGNV